MKHKELSSYAMEKLNRIPLTKMKTKNLILMLCIILVIGSCGDNDEEFDLYTLGNEKYKNHQRSN